MAVVSTLVNALFAWHTPSLSDLFLLENPFSNSQVTNRIQYDVLSTRTLVQKSIFNSAYFGRAA